jgi:predicted cupin superfamily sugar epimerase
LNFDKVPKVSKIAEKNTHMEKDAQYWIENLQLIPHPEGGHYAETYKSQLFASENEVSLCKTRKKCTSLIYFLLKGNECSAFHRLKSDEIWLFHSGQAVCIYTINKQGVLSQEILGNEPDKEQYLQVFIPANTWFAANIIDKKDYALMSCLVSPGFEWNDFELAENAQLTAAFPQHKFLIERLCKA